MYFTSILAFIGILFTSFHGIAQDGIPEKPKPQRMVNDFASILSPAEVNALEQKLVRYNDSTSNQIIVVTVTDLGGRDETDFADRLGEKWGVGQKGKNNGIVILIKPTGGQGERKTHIAVGYGLEGAVPDATAHRIYEEEMIPFFKKKQYYQGIDAAINTLISLTKGEFTAEQYNKRKSSGNSGLFKALFPIVVVIIIFIIMGISKGKRGAISPGKTLPFWLLFSMMGSGNRSGGSWGGFSGGGGGDSGGGFGGFGGGSFGGGGSGGSW